MRLHRINLSQAVVEAKVLFTLRDFYSKQQAVDNYTRP